MTSSSANERRCNYSGTPPAKQEREETCRAANPTGRGEVIKIDRKLNENRVPTDSRISPEAFAYCAECGREISLEWSYCPNCRKEIFPQIERGIREIAKDIIAESRKRLRAEQELHFLMVELLGTINHTGKSQNE